METQGRSERQSFSLTMTTKLATLSRRVRKVIQKYCWSLDHGGCLSAPVTYAVLRELCVWAE